MGDRYGRGGGSAAVPPVVLGRIIGEAATYAALPAPSEGNYALLQVDTIGTGTAAAPQYPRGVYKTVGGVWVAELDTQTAPAPRRERFTPTNNQTVFTLAAVPTLAVNTTLLVNGNTYEMSAPNAAFTLSGSTVTWTGPFPISATDSVVAAYF